MKRPKPSSLVLPTRRFNSVSTQVLHFYSSEPYSQVEKKPDPVIESASVAEAHVKDVAFPVEDISDKEAKLIIRENQRCRKMACLNARRSLSTLLSRALTSSSSFPSRSRLTVALLNSTPVFIPEATKILTRTKTSGSGYSPLNDPSPNWRLPHVRWVLPAEFIGGRDYYFGGDLFVDGKVLRRPQLNPRVGVSNSSHRVGGRGDDDLWVITFRFPKDQEPSLQEQIDLYVKTLASRKRKREYAVSSPTSWYAGFRAFISEEMAHELSGLPLVEGFYRDSEVQHRNEDICGGHLLVDGEVVLRPTLSKMQPPKVGHLVGLIDFLQDQILDVISDRNLSDETVFDSISEADMMRRMTAF
ncbi:DAG, chloroplastic [Gossypium arboreum]|uniref:DAG, chloroplastic n=1 Tax=Gossypium arboreum TaxID=29729 RepID=A0A0B0MSS2_GOSAR|nr:DAG, chloroplastic [Gossypium arboreum]